LKPCGAYRAARRPLHHVRRLAVGTADGLVEAAQRQAGAAILALHALALQLGGVPADSVTACFEKLVRELVAQRLEERTGADWWNTCVPESVGKPVEQNRADTEKNEGQQALHQGNVDCTLFGDLASILVKEWADFDDLFPNQPWVKQRFDELERSRNRYPCFRISMAKFPVAYRCPHCPHGFVRLPGKITGATSCPTCPNRFTRIVGQVLDDEATKVCRVVHRLG
jgi:hypothetical protein